MGKRFIAFLLCFALIIQSTYMIPAAQEEDVPDISESEPDDAGAGAAVTADDAALEADEALDDAAPEAAGALDDVFLETAETLEPDVSEPCAGDAADTSEAEPSEPAAYVASEEATAGDVSGDGEYEAASCDAYEDVLSDEADVTHDGDEPELWPIYSNVRNGNTDRADSTFTLEDSEIIGYASLDDRERKVKFYSITASSEYPREDRVLKIPRRIIVTQLDGAPRAIDYTKGYYLDDKGYALEGENSEEHIQIIVDSYIDEETGEEVVIKENLCIGRAYDVCYLDENVFKAENLERQDVEEIDIPSTIVSDITYEFFTGLKNVKTINVYTSGGYDKYYVNGAEIESFRYVSSGASSKNNTGENRIYTDGVLVDTKPGIKGVFSMIVYCPPGRTDNKYNFFYGTAQNSLTVIGPHAFENCRELECIEPAARSSNGTITYNVQVICRIGESAFKGCGKLSDAKIFSDMLEYIDDEAFSGCKSLAQVTLKPTPSKNTWLGKRIFAETAIEELEIPVGYNSMTGETFKDMNALKRIDMVAGIPANEDAVNKYYYSEDGVLYRYCVGGEEEPDPEQGLELVRYPSQAETTAECPDASASLTDRDSFMVPYYTRGFDEYCFYRCEKVKNMYFPSTITSIGENRFYRCKTLKHLYFYSGLLDFEVAPADYATNNYFGLGDSSEYRYMNIHAGTNTPIYDYAMVHSKTNFLMRPDSLYDMDRFYIVPISASEAMIKDYMPEDTDNMAHLVIPNYYESGGVRYKITALGSSAMANDRIESVYFLHDMKDVASDAFYKVADRENMDDPGNINSGRLATVYVEKGNYNIGSVDGVLYSLTYNEDTDSYDPMELLYYPVGSDRDEYTTAEGISLLPEYAFWGASNLKTVNIYDTVQEIGFNPSTFEADEPRSFAGCEKLVRINVIHSDRVADSNIRYFSDDGVLYRWNPDGGVDHQGAPEILVFYPNGKRDMETDDTSPVSYVVADGCLEVRYMRNCPYLGSVTFPRSVTTIVEDAFAGTSALASIEFKTEGDGDGIQLIGDRAFAETDLQTLDIPGTIQKIGDDAFYDCNDIAKVLIEGDSLTRIGDRAFYRSSDSFGTSQLTELEIYCNLVNATGENLSIGQDAFRANTRLGKVAITNMGNVDIGASAFRDATALRELDFSNSYITGLGARAFQACSELTELDLTDQKGITAIEDYAFSRCTSLQDVKLPGNVDRIESAAFRGCTSLETLNFEDLTVLESIGDLAFANTRFITVNLPDSLKTLGNSAFLMENGYVGLLSSIRVPASLTFPKETDSQGNELDYFKDMKGKGPFYGYGKSLNVYGPVNCDTDMYIQFMDMKGYEAPTFIGQDYLPLATVDLQESEVDVFDVGDNFPLLTAVVSSQDDLRDYSVRWYIIDPSICYLADETYDDINTSTCRVHGLKLGSTRVYAINKQTGAADFCVVNVKTAGVEVDPTDKVDTNLQNVDGMILPKSIILNTKGSNKHTELNATSVPARKIYYRSNDRKIARVNRKGIVTGRKPGNTIVLAYAGEGETYVEAEVEVTVYKPVIKLDRKKLKMNSEGDEESTFAILNATHSGAYNEVTWESSNPRVCTVDGDGDIGMVRAAGPGKAFVYATCNGLRARCKVVVSSAQISLDTSSLMLYAGTNTVETYQLKVTTSGLKKDVTWISDDPNVATVSEKGLVTARSAGSTVIRAICNGLEATCHVRVLDSSVTIYGGESGDNSEPKKEIVVNAQGDNTYQLYARVVGRSDEVIWKSTAPNAFTVSKEGLITGKGGGYADVTATANGDTASCKVRVLNNYTELDCPNMTLHLGGPVADKSFTLTVLIEGADPRKSVKWEVEDPEIVTLGANSGVADMDKTEYGGKAQCTVTALNEGETVVRVTANGLTDECRIRVKKD